MSEKLPVGDVLNEAFQFGLHRWATILRFAWLPVVLMIAVFLAYIFAVLDMTTFMALDGESGDLEMLSDLLRVPMSVAVVVGIVLYIVLSIPIAGFIASVYRLVALGEERPGLFQLRVDGPAWRVFWAYIIMALISTLIWAGAAAAAFSLTGNSLPEVASAFYNLFAFAAEVDGASQPSPEMLDPFVNSFNAIFLAMLFALIPILYVNIKLTPFLPGSASENRLLLIGSFRMTFGHFWSILGIFILLIIFLLIISLIFQLAMVALQLLVSFLAVQGAGLEIVAMVLGILFIVVSIFFQAFIMAVQIAAPAIIYRRLSTGE